MADPYNQHPSYPVAPCDTTGNYLQDGQYHSSPYQYGESYSHNGAPENHYPPYDPNQPPQIYQTPTPEGPSFGATQGNPFDPSVGALHPGTETGPYKTGENMSYYAPTTDKRRHSRSPSPMRPRGSNPKIQVEEETDSSSAEGERGLGGTLAGGAAGYYVGHKKKHGFLGALGGAILGNYLEEKVKDKRDDDRDSYDGHDHDGHHHGRHRHRHHHHHHHHGHRSHSRHSSHSGSRW